MSSCPPTILRRPSSTRMSRVSRPCRGRGLGVPEEARVDSRIAEDERLAIDAHRPILHRPDQILGRIHQREQVAAVRQVRTVQRRDRALRAARCPRPRPCPPANRRPASRRARSRRACWRRPARDCGARACPSRSSGSSTSLNAFIRSATSSISIAPAESTM